MGAQRVSLKVNRSIKMRRIRFKRSMNHNGPDLIKFDMIFLPESLASHPPASGAEPTERGAPPRLLLQRSQNETLLMMPPANWITQPESIAVWWGGEEPWWGEVLVPAPC